MRIVYVVPGGVDPPDGDRIIPFVHHLVRAMAARHDVAVVAIGHDAVAREWTLFDVPVINIPIGAHGKTDIAKVLAAAPGAAARHGTPDVVHGLWANLPGLAAGAIALRHRIPSVVSVCGGELAAVPAIAYGGGLRSGTRQLARAALRAATATTVATEWMREHVLANDVSVTEVVPLGADPTRFGTDAATPVRAGRLVHVAGLNRVKDQDLLLRSFALAVRRDPTLTLTIAGGDTLDGHHRRLAAELQVEDHVEFLGHVAHDELRGVFAGADLHVLTSHHDAGPIAVVEAALCGVPTVGTAVGHVADFAALAQPAAVAIDGRAPDTLADAIAAMVSDRDRRAALARAAHTWAAAHDASFTADTFEQLYLRLTSGAGD